MQDSISEPTLAPVIKSLVDQRLSIATNGGSDDPDGKMRPRLIAEKDGQWVHAYVSEAELLKELSPGSEQTSLELAVLFDIVNGDRQIDGLSIELESGERVILPRRAFGIVHRALAAAKLDRIKVEFQQPEGATITAEVWRPFLKRFSTELLDFRHPDQVDSPPEPDVRTESSPATEEEIQTAERRLGRALPPSLRSFYSVSNGWEFGMYDRGWRVMKVEEIGWLKDVDPSFYQVAQKAEQTPGPFKKDPNGERLAHFRYQEGTRIKRSLLLTDQADEAIWLLDPETSGATGEWPARSWKHWDPETHWDIRNIYELMRDERLAIHWIEVAHEQERHGYTRAHVVALRGDAAEMKIVLTYGLDPRKKNAFGETALDLARMNNFLEVVKIIENPPPLLPEEQRRFVRE